jgi:hypothetical protein
VDGKTLFFVKALAGNATSLWRMPVGGGDEVQVVPSVFRYNFAVTDRGLYYSTPALPDKASTIDYLDFATGRLTSLYKLAKPVDLGLAVSPDRRYLLFAQNDFSGSDLMLVEGFR